MRRPRSKPAVVKEVGKGDDPVNLAVDGLKASFDPQGHTAVHKTTQLDNRVAAKASVLESKQVDAAQLEVQPLAATAEAEAEAIATAAANKQQLAAGVLEVDMDNSAVHESSVMEVQATEAGEHRRTVRCACY